MNNTELNEAAEKYAENYNPEVFQHIDKEWFVVQLIKFATQWQLEQTFDATQGWYKKAQKQVPTDEEIEKLAEEEYPLDEKKHKDFEKHNTSVQWLNNVILKEKREAFIKGFKSALQYTKSSVGDAELLKEKDGQIKELKDALDVALLVIKQNNAVTKQ